MMPFSDPASSSVPIRLVRQRPRIAGTEQRRGNAGGKQLDPIGGGVPDMAEVVPPRRRLQRALDEAVSLPVIQFADDVSRRGLPLAQIPPVRGRTTSRPLRFLLWQKSPHFRGLSVTTKSPSRQASQAASC